MITIRPARTGLPTLPKPPSEYVRSDSCFVSCEPDEEGLAHTARVLGANGLFSHPIIRTATVIFLIP